MLSAVRLFFENVVNCRACYKFTCPVSRFVTFLQMCKPKVSYRGIQKNIKRSLQFSLVVGEMVQEKTQDLHSGCLGLILMSDNYFLAFILFLLYTIRFQMLSDQVQANINGLFTGHRWFSPVKELANQQCQKCVLTCRKMIDVACKHHCHDAWCIEGRTQMRTSK